MSADSRTAVGSPADTRAELPAWAARLIEEGLEFRLAVLRPGPWGTIAGLFPKLVGLAGGLGACMLSRDGYRLVGGGIGGWFVGIILGLLTITVLGVLGHLAARRMIRAMEADPRQAMRLLARSLTGMAVLIGGQARAWRSEEFLADLTRAGASGRSLSEWAQIRYSFGLVRGALALRVRDLCDPLVSLLDWSLAKPRTEKVAAVATIAVASYFFATKGIAGMLANLENIATAGGLVYGPGLWLRDRRSVPSVPARQNAKKSQP